jgi:hypothetical protein
MPRGTAGPFFPVCQIRMNFQRLSLRGIGVVGGAGFLREFGEQPMVSMASWGMTTVRWFSGDGGVRG